MFYTLQEHGRRAGILIVSRVSYTLHIYAYSGYVARESCGGSRGGAGGVVLERSPFATPFADLGEK